MAGRCIPVFETKILSREAFDENPHYIVFFKGRIHVTIMRSRTADDPERSWCLVGNRAYWKLRDEFGSAHEALEFVKKHAASLAPN
jgi:hypothetical protein